MRFDETQVLASARAADIDDLLDRVTAYRAGLEPEAVEIIEMELHRRGVTAAQIAEHARQFTDCLRAADGTVLMCSHCRKPAVGVRWGWHWLWGWAPVFPRRFLLCRDHQGSNSKEDENR